MLEALTQHVASFAATWAQRRQGRDARAVTLQRRRIYILPTRFGVVFGFLVFAMLLGSLNYGASLGFALTFLLASLGLVIMHHCHNNLLATQIRFAGAIPVFAGQPALFRIALVNTASVTRYELELAHDKHVFGPVDIEPGHSKTLEIAAPTAKRGWLHLARFAVATRHPGSLFRAWTWVHMDARCLVYPTPAPPGRPIPMSIDSHGTRGMPAEDDSDFMGLRPATAADSPSRLAWKAYARTGELMLKQFSGAAEVPSMLDWDSLPGLSTDARLAQLARWCLDAAADRRSFGLRLPTVTRPTGSGDKHLQECLEALALFEWPER
jgi:uncharacterized protein (DUF58 family)